MSKTAGRVWITGVGPVSGLGLGAVATWDALCAGSSAVAPITRFDPSGFACRVAAEVDAGFKVRDFVPKTYRKATKVMARDIELAVAAADLAARDAGLVTPGTDPDAPPTYPPERVGAHIGAGLIAADVDELTAALHESRAEDGGLDLHHWGAQGMQHLTPLWLLKYLPNMLACHVTIIHETRGPSNTITCAEASSGLSIGESLRVIQRGAADACLCGGAESKVNPMAFYRQQLTGRLVEGGEDDPGGAVRPMDLGARGAAVGEGGGIVVLESAEAHARRSGGAPYAEVVGFAASQGVNPEKRNREPEAKGRALSAAIGRALKEAGVGPAEVDLIVAGGLGVPAWDQAEAAALREVFGKRLAELAVLTPKAALGNCGAGAGGLDVAVAALALRKQALPATINRDRPLEGIAPASPGGSATLRHALVCATGYGLQHAALVLRAPDA